MDHRNPYGMGAQPTSRIVNVSGPMQNGFPNHQMQPQQQNGFYMDMFSNIMMPNGMYQTGQPQMQHPNQTTHSFPTQHQQQFHPQQQAVHGHLVQLMPNQGIVTPENEPNYEEIMNVFGPSGLGDVSVGMNTPVEQLGMHNQQVQQAMRMGQPNGTNHHNSLQDSSLISPQMNQSNMGRVGNIRANQMQQLSPNPNNQIPNNSNTIQPNGSRMQVQQQSPMISGVSDSMVQLNRNQQQPNTSTNIIMGNPSGSIQSNSFNSNHIDNFALVDSRTVSGGPALSTGSNSDEDGDMGDDDSTKKKERRRQQVRYASRRRRKKQKDEESFLRDRIEELKEQIKIIGGDLSAQCSAMAGMSEQALTEAYEKQMATVTTLRQDNNALKEQLLKHENFARMIQYGLNALPSDCRDVDRKKIGNTPFMFGDYLNPLRGPTLVVDLSVCHEAVREAYNELKSFGPPASAKTNVCHAMGWKTELWASGTCLSFKAVRSISAKNIREVASASWDIITSADKCKRIYPDIKQFRILQKVNDDIVVVHRIASVASDVNDRELISVAFRFRDENNYYIGFKSITVQAEPAENCVRAEECQGWMFTGGPDESAQWKAHYLGYYDVKGEKDDKILNQLANEAMFGMLRWESEAMHPITA